MKMFMFAWLVYLRNKITVCGRYCEYLQHKMSDSIIRRLQNVSVEYCNVNTYKFFFL